MREPIIQDFSKIVQDFHYVLTHLDSQAVIWKRDKESIPDSQDFSFQLKQPTISESTTQTHSGCVLCRHRIFYKADHDTPKTAAVPYLLLVHNDELISGNCIYQKNQLNKEMHDLLDRANVKASSFLVREVLRCHFDKNDVSNSEYINNCLEHLRADIKNLHVKKILIVGEAIRLLFPNKKSIVLGQWIKYEDLPAILTPGPSRLLYMKKNSFESHAFEKEREKIISNIKLFLNDH